MLLGCTCQAGEDCRNVARHVALLSGLPPTVPGADGQSPVRVRAGGGAGCRARHHRGEGELYLAGGVESMSRAPFVVGKAEPAFAATSGCSTRPSARAFRIR